MLFYGEEKAKFFVQQAGIDELVRRFLSQVHPFFVNYPIQFSQRINK